jgi:hypothetical protein
VITASGDHEAERAEAPFQRVEPQPELFERDHAEQACIAAAAEDDSRDALGALDREGDMPMRRRTLRPSAM